MDGIRLPCGQLSASSSGGDWMKSTPSVHAVAMAASESARDACIGDATSPETTPPVAAATEADADSASGAATGSG